LRKGYKSAGFDSAVLENAIIKTEKRMLVEQEKEQAQESMFRMSWW